MRSVLQLTILCVSVISGCKKDDIGQSPVIDKVAFVAIKIDGVDYISYGYTANNPSDPYGGPFLQHTNVTTGVPMSLITLTASKTYQPAGSSNSNTLQLGNCDLHMVLIKDNLDLIGNYTIFVGGYQEQTINRNSIEEAYFDSRAMMLTIERVINHPKNNARMVEGRLSGLVFKSSSAGISLPVSGNFRMYIN
jgi:hypothetical protein